MVKDKSWTMVTPKHISPKQEGNNFAMIDDYVHFAMSNDVVSELMFYSLCYLKQNPSVSIKAALDHAVGESIK